MARLAKADIHKALDKAANHILEAGGSDGITSREDIRKKLTQLQGVERRLVDVFYRFMDHRDASSGARITKKDVEETVAYAKARMIDKYDLNQNGLSKDEISKMSLTGKLAVAFARILKRAALINDDTKSKALTQQIDELAPNLYFDDFGSEAAIQIKSFYLDTKLGELTEANFNKVLDLDPSDPNQQLARFEEIGDFWEAFVDVQMEEYKAQARDLVELLRANLTGMRVIIQGADNVSVDSEHPVYVVGLTPWGDIVGFESFVVWT
ncbi:MAG: nuclease [Bacteroidota bacterium]